MGFSEAKARFIGEVWQGTVGQIRRAPEIGVKWKEWADTQSVELVKLGTIVTDGANSFISNIDRLNAASQDPVKGPLIDLAIQVITNGEYTTNQARTVMGNLRSACVALRNAPKTTYAEISSALATFIAAVPVVPDDVNTAGTMWT